MTPGDVAGLIAAVAFVALVGFLALPLIKLGRVFDRAALDAVKRWKFQPVGSPVTSRRSIGFSPGN